MDPVTLADGRRLDLHAAGEGPLLVFHHGTPGSVLPPSGLQDAALRSGLRFVSYSRAGYGGSARRAGRSVADVVADLEQVLDHLGADRCVTAGWSGGGPHALAMAALLPDRVAGVLSIAGVAPYDADGLDFLSGMGEENVEEFGAATRGEAAIRGFAEAQAPELRSARPEEIVQAMGSLLPEVDRRHLTGGFGAELAASFADALRVSVDGWIDDDLAFVRSWGFDPAAIAVPCFVWQGEEDKMVPFAHGQWLASRIPGATAHLMPGEGHLSIAIGAADTMLAELGATLG